MSNVDAVETLNRPTDAVEMLNTETKDDVNSSLISLLECPICLSYMGPPLQQCPNGHIVCSDCFPKIENCPVCRENVENRDNCPRNRMAEQLSQILLFPCRNKEEGCNKVFRFTDMAKHSTLCAYRTYNCLVMKSVCNWQGIKDELYTHVSAEHEGKAWNTPYINFKCSEEFGINSFETSGILEAYGELFLINLLWEKDCNLFGVVICIGVEEGASKFRYSFVFDNNTTNIIYQDVTKPETIDFADICKRGNCFSLDAKIAAHFKRDNALQFNIQVIKV